MKRLPFILAALYLLSVQLLFGVGTEHLFIVGLLLTGYYAHQKSRQLILDLLPLALFGVLYDFLRAIPKSWTGPIHVIWPYELEKSLFGFSYHGTRIIPNEYFASHHSLPLDLLTAITYSLHVVVPIGFFLWTWFKHRPLSRHFAWAFLLVNLLAFLTYILLPVAPPWYVEQYGLVPGDWTTPGNVAGLVYFDQWIGIPYFEHLYARSAWVFGAIPSMHAGFPVLVILFAHKVFKKGVIPFYCFAALVWFSAVYLRHHYIIDLLAGAFYSFVVHQLMKKVGGTSRYRELI